MDPTDYEVVDSVERLSEVVPTLFHLATNPPSLYIDLEGRDLCRHGKISLISIFAAPLQKVFLIDVHVLGADAVGSPSESGGRNNLRILLENKSIPKVLFDCRNDADALYNLFKVDLGGVIDLQLMELATRKGHRRFLNGLAKTIRDYGGLSESDLRLWTETKNNVKSKYFHDPVEGVEITEGPFDQRPLPEELLRYSIQDVTILPRLWQLFDSKLNPTWRAKVETEVFWRVQLSRQEMYYGGNRDTATLGPW